MPKGKNLGDILEIELPNGKKAYGRVYKEYILGIYNGFYNSINELDFNIGYYRFIELYKDDLNKLKTVAEVPFVNSEDSWAPDRVIVDAITGKGSLYHHGKIYPCSYDDCKNLEVVAVWNMNHLIDMLMGDDKWDKAIRRPIDV